jgi:hypothetical protein
LNCSPSPTNIYESLEVHVHDRSWLIWFLVKELMLVVDGYLLVVFSHGKARDLLFPLLFSG